MQQVTRVTDGLRYLVLMLTVLALGGGKHPMEVFKTFRGREPSTIALLRHNGLVSAAAN